MNDLFGSSGTGSVPAATIYSIPLVLDEMCSQNMGTNTPLPSQEQPVAAGMDYTKPMCASIESVPLFSSSLLYNS